MSRIVLRAAALLVLALSADLAPLRAEVHSGRQVVWDFTDPAKVATLVRWTDAEHVKATAEGLGWADAADASRDVTVRSRQPVSVGWTWHPATAVTVSAE